MRTWVVWCQICTNKNHTRNIRYFSTDTERDRWAIEHTRVTGHSWFVLILDDPFMLDMSVNDAR